MREVKIQDLAEAQNTLHIYMRSILCPLRPYISPQHTRVCPVIRKADLIYLMAPIDQSSPHSRFPVSARLELASSMALF